MNTSVQLPSVLDTSQQYRAVERIENFSYQAYKADNFQSILQYFDSDYPHTLKSVDQRIKEQISKEIDYFSDFELCDKISDLVGRHIQVLKILETKVDEKLNPMQSFSKGHLKQVAFATLCLSLPALLVGVIIQDIEVTSNKTNLNSNQFSLKSLRSFVRETSVQDLGFLLTITVSLGGLAVLGGTFALHNFFAPYFERKKLEKFFHSKDCPVSDNIDGALMPYLSTLGPPSIFDLVLKALILLSQTYESYHPEISHIMFSDLLRNNLLESSEWIQSADGQSILSDEEHKELQQQRENRLKFHQLILTHNHLLPFSS